MKRLFWAIVLQPAIGCFVVSRAQVPADFQFPTSNYQSSISFSFGAPNPQYGNKLHSGEDISASFRGMPVYAAGTGKIMLARPWKSCPNWGYVLVIEHVLSNGSKVSSIYGHLDANTVGVSEGQVVSRGTFLGLTGIYPCWSEHLHFGVHVGDYGAPVGTYPTWLAGYLSPSTFPDDYVQPSGFILAHLAVARFAYVANNDSGTVSGYSIDSTGALRPIPGSPFSAGSGPIIATVDPTNRFLYVANSGGGPSLGLPTSAGSISGYTIDPNSGALSPVPGSPFPAELAPILIRIDPRGRFLYVANLMSNNISAYSINSASGQLTPAPGSPFAAGLNPVAITLNLTGKFAYAANVGSGNISGYSIDATTGALIQMSSSPFPAGSVPGLPVSDPTGHFLYVANFGSNNVSAFAIDSITGALTQIPGSPFFAGSSPTLITLDTRGKFAYVANRDSSNVSAYSINSTTGALTPVSGSPFQAGTKPKSVTVDQVSRFAYVANAGTSGTSGSISAYSIDAGTGALTPVSGSPFAAGIGPILVTLDPSGKFAYVANHSFESGGISAFQRNMTTGALTPISVSPFASGIGPTIVILSSGPTP